MKQRKNYSTYELRTNGKESEWANVGWETERTSDWVSETEKSCQPVSQWIKVSVFQRVNESVTQWVGARMRYMSAWIRVSVIGCVRIIVSVNEWLGSHETFGLKRSEWSNEWMSERVSLNYEWMSERVSLNYEWMIECVFGWGSEDYHG